MLCDGGEIIARLLDSVVVHWGTVDHQSLLTVITPVTSRVGRGRYRLKWVVGEGDRHV